MKKNEEKWKGKVRIVAISVGDINEILEIIERNSWNRIEHYRMKNGLDD